MELEFLFCDEVKKLQELCYPDTFGLFFTEDCKMLTKAVDNIYGRDDYDIEDSSDIIQMINSIVMRIIIDDNFTVDQKRELLKIRIYSKKMAKKKYRDFKYNDRTFWNCEEAHQQYNELVKYVWKPSVAEIKKL